MAVYTAIDDPSANFQALAYSGDGNNNRAVTNTGNSDLQPDLLWIKRRQNAEDADIQDSTRGIGNRLRPARDDPEITDDTAIDSFDSDGFTIDSNDQVNNSSDTYIAWQWKANGGSTTAVSASGDVQASTYQANTTAGFSILTWTGTGNNKQITHGLGARADWIMVKNRDATNHWAVWSRGRANESSSASFKLNTDDATSASPNPFDGNLGTASIFWINGGDDEVNANTEKYVAYCWRNIQGYSKAGLYVGNGTSGDGAFVYLGFKPAFVLTKASSAADGSWSLRDNARDPLNYTNQRLRADTSGAEDQDWNMDFYSNGFKWYDGGGATNGDGETYIYLAFAESPFVTSTGIPATAR